MAVDEWKTRIFTVTVASGATSSSEVDLGAYFTRLCLEMPASNTWDTYVQVAHQAGGTYRRIYEGQIEGASDAAYFIASSISNCNIAIPANGRFYKLEVSTAAANGATYYLVGIE